MADNAVSLIAQARAMGLTLTVRDGTIHPSGPMHSDSKALLAAMRPLKAAILEALQAELEFSLDDVEALPVEPLPPMGIRSAKQPLPVDMWRGGLTPLAALSAHAILRQQYFCTCGADSTGWYVRCNPAHYQVQPA